MIYIYSPPVIRHFPPGIFSKFSLVIRISFGKYLFKTFALFNYLFIFRQGLVMQPRLALNRLSSNAQSSCLYPHARMISVYQSSYTRLL